MKSKKIIINYQEYESISEVGKEEALLLHAAEEACQKAYAPYSSFKVGAALLLENGITITGNNQENAAYPSGLCAERVAMFAAASQYPGVAFKMLAIVAQSEKFVIDYTITPCGACRQVMAEYENNSGKPIKIILKGPKEKILILEGVEKMLPLIFNAKQILSLK